MVIARGVVGDVEGVEASHVPPGRHHGESYGLLRDVPPHVLSL